MKSRELVQMAAVVAAGLAIVAIYAWPGLLAWDSVVQLEEGRAHVYSDWHPPVMAAIWAVLDRVVRGPGLMLLLQCGLFVGGTYALLRRRARARAAAFATLLIFVFPPTLGAMAVVVKDSLMWGALIAALAMWTSDRTRWRIGSLVLWWLAAAVRVNAFSIVIPLVAWLCPWPASRGVWTQRAVGLAIAAALSGAGWLANAALHPRPTHMLELALIPSDLVGTVCFAPDLDDAQVRALLDGVTITPSQDLQGRACLLQDPMVHPETLIHSPLRFVDEPPTPEGLAAMRSAWLRVMRTYPGEYLWNRLDRFRVLLGLTDVAYFPVWTTRYEHRLLVDMARDAPPRGVVQRWLSIRMEHLGFNSHIIFRPYVYLLLSIILWIVRRRDRMIFALQLSSATCLALVFFVAPGPDIRYAEWTMVTVLVGVAMHLLMKQTSGGGGGGGTDAREVEREQRAIADDDGAVDRDVPHVA
jgi:hypothetical protein